MNDPTYTKAIFLRDRKERLVSAYLQKVVQSKGEGFATLCCKHVKGTSTTTTTNNNNNNKEQCISQAPTLL
jgi:hypothetical protein